MRIAPASIAMALGIGLAACQTTGPPPMRTTGEVTAQPSAAGRTISAEGPTAVLWVKGLGCPGCIVNIERQLQAVEGVEHIEVDLGSGRVDIALSAENPASRQQLRDAIDKSGFTLDRMEAP